MCRGIVIDEGYTFISKKLAIHPIKMVLDVSYDRISDVISDILAVSNVMAEAGGRYVTRVGRGAHDVRLLTAYFAQDHSKQGEERFGGDVWPKSIV